MGRWELSCRRNPKLRDFVERSGKYAANSNHLFRSLHRAKLQPTAVGCCKHDSDRKLGGGGRVAYDLRTGLETTIEPVVDYVAPEAELETQIVGGAEYPCAQYVPLGYREWYSTSGSQLPRLGLVYDVPSRTIALYLID